MLYFFLLIICLCSSYAIGMENKCSIVSVASHLTMPKGGILIVHNGVPIVDTHNVYGKSTMQCDDIDTNVHQNSTITKQEGTKKITFDKNGKMKITLVDKNGQ